MFSELFPIVLTPNVDRALSFYRDDLGGTVEFEYPGPSIRPYDAAGRLIALAALPSSLV